MTDNEQRQAAQARRARIEQQAKDAQREADMRRVRDAFQAGVKRKEKNDDEY